MFYIIRKLPDDTYAVLDTSDFIINVISYDELRTVRNMGYKIESTEKLTLLYNLYTRLVKAKMLDSLQDLKNDLLKLFEDLHNFNSSLFHPLELQERPPITYEFFNECILIHIAYTKYYYSVGKDFIVEINFNTWKDERVIKIQEEDDGYEVTTIAGIFGKTAVYHFNSGFREIRAVLVNKQDKPQYRGRLNERLLE